MIELLRKLIRKEESTVGKAVSSENKEVVKFTLKLGDLPIGYLTFADGLWFFTYSEEFKMQTKYNRLTGFSDVNKVYKSEELWPFFKIRIPGLKQPMVKDIIRTENLDESDEAILLRRFGKKTMSNPYVLESL